MDLNADGRSTGPNPLKQKQAGADTSLLTKSRQPTASGGTVIGCCGNTNVNTDAIGMVNNALLHSRSMLRACWGASWRSFACFHAPVPCIRQCTCDKLVSNHVLLSCECSQSRSPAPRLGTPEKITSTTFAAPNNGFKPRSTLARNLFGWEWGSAAGTFRGPPPLQMTLARSCTAAPCAGWMPWWSLQMKRSTFLQS